MNDTRPLRAALLANTVFSTACGLLLILGPHRIGDLLGIQAPSVLQAVGLGLLLFAGDLLHQATRPRTATWRALYAVAGDYLWVVGTFTGLLLFPRALSDSGLAVVIATAGVVFLFGTWQLWAVDRAHRSHRSPETGSHRHCVRVRVNAPAEAMWEVLSRFGEIHDHLPSLKSSEILEGKSPGVGAIRRCVDHAGRTWSEECIGFDPGRGFVVRFLTDAPDFPFPAKTMIGGWEVNSEGEDSEVKVWWELEPKPQILAPVLVPLLAFQADRDFKKVIRSMARDALREGSEADPGREATPTARLLPGPC